MTKIKKCRDCEAQGVTTLRPAPHPGPRCVTHHREVTKARKAAAHDNRVVSTYDGMGPGDYAKLYLHQGGVCAGCRRAKGTGRRRLAVDHNHETGEVRGLLCSPCNQLVGHFRDDPQAFLRLAEYLVNPPARAVLRAQEDR